MRLIQECAKNGEFQEVEILSATDPGIYYLVTVAPWDTSAAELVCECFSYEHRGYCRHQREAFAQICRWSELDGKAQTAEQAAKRLCPECGGPTQAVVIGDE